MNYQPLPLMSSTAAPPLVRQTSRFGLAGTSALAILMALLWLAGDCRAQNNTGASSIWYLSGVTLTSAAMPPASWWHIAGVADFNGDGHPDILYQNPLTGESQVWLLGPGGTTVIGALGLSGPNNWRIAGVGDFNGDGKPDVVWQDPVTGVSQVWYLGGAQGTDLIGAAGLSGANSWRIVAIGDFNRDGKPDLVWQDLAGGAMGGVQIWYMNGASLSSVTSLGSSNTYRVVAAGNFGGNSETDLVWQETVTGAAVVWYMQYDSATGNQNLTGADYISTGNSWTVVGAADFDGDHNTDLLWQDLVRAQYSAPDVCYAQFYYSDEVTVLTPYDISAFSHTWFGGATTNLSSWTAGVKGELMQNGMEIWASPMVTGQDPAYNVQVTSSNVNLATQGGGTYQVMGSHQAINAPCGSYPVMANQSPAWTGTQGPMVTVDPASASVAYNQPVVIAATVTGTSNTAVTWSRTPVTCGTLQLAPGNPSPNLIQFVAPPNLSSCNNSTNATIIATSTADGSRSASANITISSAGSTILTPSSVTYTSAAHFGTIYVSVPGTTGWSASSNAAWIHLTGTTAGSGNGSIPYTIEANSGTSRTGTVTVGGQTFTVYQ